VKPYASPVLNLHILHAYDEMSGSDPVEILEA
jgi:hypothetical protein